MNAGNALKLATVALTVGLACPIRPSPAADSGVIAVPLGLTTDQCCRVFRFYTGREATANDTLPPGSVVSNTVVFDSVNGRKVKPIHAEKLTSGSQKRLSLRLDFGADGACTTMLEGGWDYFSWNTPLTAIVSDAGHRHEVQFSSGYSAVMVEGEHKSLCLETCFGFTGTLERTNSSIRLLIHDGDVDGRVAEFDEPHTRDHPGAKLILYRGADTEYGEWLPLARLMAIDSVFYGVDLRIEGTETNPTATLLLQPTNPPVAEVWITGSNVTSVLLTGPQVALRLTPKDNVLTVPVGQWTIIELRVTEDNADFVHRAVDPWTNPFELTVTADGPGTLKVGGPLRHEVKAMGLMFGGSVELSLRPSVGVGRETYMIADDHRSKPPAWAIVNRHGKEVASGVFEYG